VKDLSNRSCTDVFWLLLYICFWLGMFAVCGVAVTEGGTDRLNYGTDSYGFLCGSNNLGSKLAVEWTGAEGGDAFYPDHSEFKKLYKVNQARMRPSVAVHLCPSVHPTLSLHPTVPPSLPLYPQLDFLSGDLAVTGVDVCVRHCPALFTGARNETTGIAADNPEQRAQLCPLYDVNNPRTTTTDPETGETTTTVNPPSPVYSCPSALDYTCTYGRYSDYNVAGAPAYDGLAATDPNLDPALNVYTFSPYEEANPVGGTRTVGDWETGYWGRLNSADRLRSLVWGQGPCYPNWLAQVDYLNRCYPDLGSDSASALLGSALSFTDGDVSSTEVTDTLANSINDMLKGIGIILVCGVVVGFLMSVAWIVMLRYLTGVFVWTSVILANVCAVLACIYFAVKAGLIDSGWAVDAIAGATDAAGTAAELDALVAASPLATVAEDEIKNWEIYTWCAVAATCLLFLFTLVLIPRLKIAIAVLKVACQAVGAVPSVILWPIMPLLFEIVFLVYWIFVMVFLYSAGTLRENTDLSPTNETAGTDIEAVLGVSLPEIPAPSDKTYSQYGASVGGDISEVKCADDPGCYYEVKWEETLYYVSLYHIFGFFWTNEFILGLGTMVLGSVFAQFYFYRGDRSRMGSWPVFTALKMVGRKHLGSIAAGSFIIAVIKMIRFLVDQAEKQFKAYLGNSSAAKWVFNIVKYCLWIIEKLVRFLNKNAYIVVAITGKGYCWSAVHAVSLILKNILRFAAVNAVGGAIIWVGKLCVMGVAGLLAFLATDLDYYKDADAHPDTALSSPVFPVLFACLASYFIAEIFFMVYDMGVDTILLCFCEDLESSKGSPQYAPALLMEAIGKGDEFEKKRAEEKAERLRRNQESLKKSGLVV